MTSVRSQSTAPIQFGDIRRSFHSVRIAGGTVMGALGILAVVWGVSGWLYLVVPAALVVVHAVHGLRHSSSRALGAVVIDITLFGSALFAIGEVPQAEVGALGYVLVTSILLLSLTEAALFVAYTAAWAVVVTNLAPVAAERTSASTGGSIDRLIAVVFLVLTAGVLLATARVIRRVRNRHVSELAAQREADRLKSDFVSMVSHEFRTPLTSIAGFVETLSDEWRSLPAEEVDEFLGLVRSESIRLGTLVEDLLVIPRLETGELPLQQSTFELGNLVSEVVDLVYIRGDHEPPRVTIPDGILVHADPNRVAQVLRNLLENAIIHGGASAEMSGEPTDDGYRVVVSDDGPGVPGDQRDRIFEQFQQGTTLDAPRYRGLGLGLAIARRLARAMDGDLWHESRSPRGSHFCFTIPQVLQPVHPSEPRAESRV